MPAIAWILMWIVVIAGVVFFNVRAYRRKERAAGTIRSQRNAQIQNSASLRGEFERFKADRHRPW
jgi:hypothetical protein